MGIFGDGDGSILCGGSGGILCVGATGIYGHGDGYI